MSVSSCSMRSSSSIYFRDPNWYPLEITRSLRDVEEPDAVDAAATIAAALDLEESGGWKNIEQLWRNKVKFVQASQDMHLEKAPG